MLPVSRSLMRTFHGAPPLGRRTLAPELKSNLTPPGPSCVGVSEGRSHPLVTTSGGEGAIASARSAVGPIAVLASLPVPFGLGASGGSDAKPTPLSAVPTTISAMALRKRPDTDASRDVHARRLNVTIHTSVTS